MNDNIPRTQGLASRLARIRHLEDANSPGRKIPIQLLADALIKDGFLSLDQQAKALGLHRSTTWTIMKTKHKLGMLNNKTVRNILAHSDTPASVRMIIHTMLDRKD
jgi:hypothetical protein